MLAADTLLTVVIKSSDGPTEALHTPLGEVADRIPSPFKVGRVGVDQEFKNPERRHHV